MHWDCATVTSSYTDSVEWPAAPGPPIFDDFESPSETELTLHWRPPVKPNGLLTGYHLQYGESESHQPEISFRLTIREKKMMWSLHWLFKYIFLIKLINAVNSVLWLQQDRAAYRLLELKKKKKTSSESLLMSSWSINWNYLVMDRTHFLISKFSINVFACSHGCKW